MNELNIYGRFLEMCIAHTANKEWKEIHGFGVGYIDMLNTNNLDQASYRKGLFYSEKWYNEGMNPNSMPLDYPFVLMLPVAGNGQVARKRPIESEDYRCVIYVLDVLYRDRVGVTDNEYAKRSREEVFAHTHQMGQQLLTELYKSVNGQLSAFTVVGEYTFEKVYDMTNKRLAGTMFEFNLRVNGTCDGGSFNYDKTFTEKKEKFCNC